MAQQQSPTADSAQSDIVPVRLPDGSLIYASARYIGGRQDIASVGNLDLVEFAAQLETIAQVLGSAAKKACPTKAVLEFGVQLAAKSGKLTALLIEGEADATLKVTLEWAQ